MLALPLLSDRKTTFRPLGAGTDDRVACVEAGDGPLLRTAFVSKSGNIIKGRTTMLATMTKRADREVEGLS